LSRQSVKRWRLGCQSYTPAALYLQKSHGTETDTERNEGETKEMRKKVRKYWEGSRNMEKATKGKECTGE
jgi:hypothetical protein